MKTRTMTALAVLMLAASLPAAAQERGERGERGRDRAEARQERNREGGGERQRPHRGWNGGGEAARPARPAEAAPVPQAPPAAPRAAEARRASEAQTDLWRSDRQRGERRGADMRRPGRWVDNDGDDRANPSPADRIDREDRDEARDFRRWNGGDVRSDGRDLRYGGDRRGDDGRDRDRGDRDGRDRDGRDRDGRDRDGDRRWEGRWDGRWNRDDRDRWDRHDRDRDRRRGDRSYWSQGRYPFSYHSQRRYRGSRWIAPPGFYVRSWSSGDHLPWGWYGDSYRLNDWYSYGLPWPPPGFDWVRVGPDVLLVDRFNGRVVQVVRMVFW